MIAHGYTDVDSYEIICDADIGHVSPQMAMINGGFLKITSENGKGKVENLFI